MLLLSAVHRRVRAQRRCRTFAFARALPACIHSSMASARMAASGVVQLRRLRIPGLRLEGALFTPVTAEQRSWRAVDTATRRSTSTRAPELRVQNSVTRTRTPLVGKADPQTITWYQCGPTVYDSAHIGHAWSVCRHCRTLSGHFAEDICVSR